MSLYVKDIVKLWVTKDQNYKQPQFERSDDSLNTRERSDVNTFISGYAVLTNTGSTNTITLSSGDLATIRSVYIEASNTVTVNVQKSSAGLVAMVLEPETNETAKAFCDINVNTGSATLNISTAGGSAGTDNAVTVTWVLIGV